VYFGEGEDFNLTTELFEKVRYSRHQAIKNSLNEAILLMSIKEVLIRNNTQTAVTNMTIKRILENKIH